MNKPTELRAKIISGAPRNEVQLVTRVSPEIAEAVDLLRAKGGHTRSSLLRHLIEEAVKSLEAEVTRTG